MRTKEEIKELKQNWLNDPCYEIEDALDNLSSEQRKELRIFVLEYKLKRANEQLQEFIDFKYKMRKFLDIQDSQ